MEETNKEKLKWDFFPLVLIEGAVRVMMKGCKKDGRYPFSWLHLNYKYTGLFASILRHLVRMWWYNEDIDPEDGELHIDHLLCNAMMFKAIYTWGKGIDNRMDMFDKDKCMGHQRQNKSEAIT